MTKTFNIAVLPGDGIGPEVMQEAIKVLRAIESQGSVSFELHEALIGAAAIDATGDPLPAATLDTCLAADAVLFGAIGDPKYDNAPDLKVRPEQGLLGLRKALDLYANLRPVVCYPELIQASPLREEIIKGTDLLIIRELISGIYFGKPRGRSEDGNTAFDSCVYHRDEIERIAHLAFGYAKARKGKLTLVDKANVLATSRLWRETVTAMAPNYPEVEFETLFVDNAAMKLIQQPTAFDVVLTGNLFGDILSDEASVITGSLGTLASASEGLKTSLFEPVHGSYPQAAGQNRANPMAMILSAAMMLDKLGLAKEAEQVRQAVTAAIGAGVVTEDLNQGKSSTQEVGDFISQYISETPLEPAS